MIRIDIRHNFAQVEARLRTMQEDLGRRALVSAVNKAIDQARTQMVREITSEFAVSSALVRERLRVRRASRRGIAIEAELMGGRSDRRRSMNVIHFVEKSVSLATARRRAKAGTLKTLHVKVKRKGPMKPLAGAFIGNKGRTVFERVDGTRMSSRPGGRPGSKHAEKIKPVQTIEVAQMFNTKRINRAVVAMILAKFPQIFEHEARFYTQRFSKP